MKWLYWPAAAAFVLANAIPCLASSRLTPPDPSGYQHWGALRARGELSLSNAGYERWDLGSARANLEGGTTTATGHVEGLVLYGPRSFLTFSEELSRTFYFQQSSRDYTNQHGEARVTVPYGRGGLFAEAVVNRQQSRPGDELSVRPEQSQSSLASGVIVDPGWRTEIETSGQLTRYRSSLAGFTNPQGESISQRLDRNVVTGRIEADYQLMEATALAFTASLEHSHFLSLSPSSAPGGAPFSRDAVTWSLEPGIRMAEGEPLSGSVNAGWIRIDANDPRKQDFEGFIADGQLTYQPVSRTSYELSLSRSPNLTISEESSYYVSNMLGLTVRHDLNRITSIESAAVLGHNTFSGSSRVSGRTDDLRQGSLGFRFRLRPAATNHDITSRIRLEHLVQHSTRVPTQTRTVAAVDLTIEF